MKYDFIILGVDKMKKTILLTVCFMAFALVLIACNNDDDTNNVDGSTDIVENGAETNNVSSFAEFGLDENMRFIDQRTISVALWERPNERMPVMANSYWAEWVAAQMLELHNVVIDWETIPRWGPEYTHMGTLLGSNSAPDVSYTLNVGVIATFAGMGGLQDLAPLLERYNDFLPYMYNLLGEELIYWQKDPNTGQLFNITGRLFQDGSNLMFIREDWLAALDLDIPTNLEEFEYTLRAFRDRASELPGYENMSFVVPYMLGSDVTWHGGILHQSLVPNDITDRDWFVYGKSGNSNERLFHHRDVMFEGARLWNQWFNEGLLYSGFAISDDVSQGDLITLGQVGAFSGNWDFPFRGDPGFIAGVNGIRENIGPDANFIPILPFVNDVGEQQIFMPNPIDRRIFFPNSNTEQLASLLYLDFMSRPETLDFLQFGFEGRHHEVLDGGVIAMLSESEDNPWPDNQLFTVIRNFDLALMVNGIHFWDTDPVRAERTTALGYPGIEADAIITARNLGLDNGRWFAPVPHPPIYAEEGTIPGLIAEREDILRVLIAGTSPENFEAEFNRLYDAYLLMGGQAIIDERAAIWESIFGN